MENGFRIKTVLPAEPKAVYQAWLSGREHSAMTGGVATASDKEGASFTAWNGYIEGRNLKLTPHWCIIQSWRTTKFSDSDPDSRLELCIHPSGGGSELLLIHTEIPPDQVEGYRSGWVDYYFEPMKAYFAARKPAKAKKKSAKKRPARRKSAKKKKAKRRTLRR
ncbi:MAG: SRPBCC domain-containing protein [Xanthobacteraceae bacterium]